jgi:hypothetical protein
LPAIDAGQYRKFWDMIQVVKKGEAELPHFLFLLPKGNL